MRSQIWRGSPACTAGIVTYIDVLNFIALGWAIASLLHSLGYPTFTGWGF
jgi:multidrug transporter EmrE-like cation transporter